MRKKIIIILIISLIFCFVCMYNENNQIDLKKSKLIQTNGNPVSTHTIVLDAGHGQPDRTALYLLMVFLKKK